MPTPTLTLALAALTVVFAAACTATPPEDVETSGTEVGASAPFR